MAKETSRRQRSLKKSDNRGHPDIDLPESRPKSARGKIPIPNQQENGVRIKRKTELLDRLVSVECVKEDKVALSPGEGYSLIRA